MSTYPVCDSFSFFSLQALAVAQAAGVKLTRGLGSKPSFFGKGPFLELPSGQVVSGLPGVVRAIALVSQRLFLPPTLYPVSGCSSFPSLSQLHAPQLSPSRPAVDDWLEWAFSKLSPVAVKHDDASALIEEISILDHALSKGQPYLLGSEQTLADLVVAPQAERALSFFGEKEYVSTSS